MKKSYTILWVCLVFFSTFAFNAGAQLSGVYTINSAVITGGTNFQTFNDFATALNTQGVSGPVTVNVALGSGPYVEQVTFTQATGVSTINKVTINGNNNLITFNPTVTAQRWTIRLNGADWMVINELQVQTTNNTQGTPLILHGGANFNMFSSCTFSCPANQGTSTNQICVQVSGNETSPTAAGASGNYNTWDDCHTFGGYYGFSFYSNTTVNSSDKGNIIKNCHIQDFYLYGLYLAYHDQMTFQNNLLERPTRTNHTTCYAVFIQMTIGTLVEGNIVQKLHELNQTHTGTTIGYYLYGNINAGAPAGSNIARNNIMRDIRTNSTVYGLYVLYWGQAHHNTIVIDHPQSTATSAFWGVYYATTGIYNVDCKSNMIYCNRGGSGGKYGIYYGSTALVSSNNNNIWMGPSGTNNYAGYYLANHTTLAQLQTASAQEANSYSIDPVFVNSNTDQHPTAVALDNLALPLGVVFDQEKMVRNQSTPDIGALEFLTPLCSGMPGLTSVNGPNFAICPGESISMAVGNFIPSSGITYEWKYSNQSSVGPFNTVSPPSPTNLFYAQSNVTNPGWYQIVATCTNPGGAQATAVLPIQIAGPTASTVPAIDGFEGIGLQNRLPNCSWASNSLGDACQTYVTSGSGNRVPRTGTSFGTFNNNSPGTNYYYTNPIQMNVGITYSAAIHYATEYFGHNNWPNLSIMVGPNQSSVGMVQVASVSPALSGQYKLLNGLFTVPSSGQYYVAIRATSTAGSAQYLMIDDLSVTIPCQAGSPNSPTVSISVSSNTVCAGDQVGVNAIGADTYSWSEGSTGSSISFFPTQFNNSLTVYGTNLLSGCTTTATQMFVVNPSPNVFISASNPTVCAGKSTILTAYGADQYAWSNGPTSTNITVNPTTTTPYTVVGINSFGCSATANYNVQVSPNPLINVISSNPGEACKDDVLSLSASGAVTYIWISNATSQLYQGSVINVTSPATAVFTITGTNANGCQGSTTLVQSISECTGIEKNAGLNGLSVFPNPTSGLVNIVFANEANTSLEVIDVTGRLVMMQEVSTSKTQLDISTLANGIYYLRITSNEASNMLKLIKE